MEKHKIIVPKGIRYISDWKEYNLDNYPFPHILNKELTGCGYTEFCIKNSQDLILVSPRKFLLQNKQDQHPDEVLYVNNNLEVSIDYELDITDDKGRISEKAKDVGESRSLTVNNLTELKDRVRNHFHKCTMENKPCKILVTYDSFRHVKDALGSNMRFFQVVVDEFQSIFIDARFKSSTELELLEHICGRENEGGYKIEKVCFVSATPMIDKYLEMVPEFKDLPYYSLDWETADTNRVRKPQIDIKISYQSIGHEAKLVIQRYLKGGEKLETRSNPVTGELVTSDEAVLFFNSVSGICQAIRKNLLLPEQCNIICADSTSNKKSLRDAFNYVYKKLDTDEKEPRKFPTFENPIGTIPLKGKPHKMFTFCTRTVYLGADFYSTKAKSFIFSDSNIDCLSVDISMDLEQILGRQRLDENPWKGSASLIVITTRDKKKIAQEHFDNILNSKIESSKSLLRIYDKTDDVDKETLAKNYQKVAKMYHYKDDYIAINRFIDKDGKTYYKPVFNNLMYVSELRAFEVQQEDYKDRFSVFSAIKEGGLLVDNEEVILAAQEFNNLKNTTEKLKLLIELSEEKDIKYIDDFLSLIPGKYRDYFNVVGKDRIRANGYKEIDIKREWRAKVINESVSDSLTVEIYKNFLVGSRYTKAEIKNQLKSIYKKVGYTKTAKATDLGLYFIMKQITTTDRKNGFEIIAKR